MTSATRIATNYVQKRAAQRSPLLDVFSQNAGLPPVKGYDLLRWIKEYRKFLIPDRMLDLVNHPYLVEIYSQTARRVVLQKAGQMGLSEYAISFALHACDQRSATVLYVFPTELHVQDFSTARLSPAIEASPYLRKVVVDQYNSTMRGADRTTLKRVRNRFLYFRGGKVQQNGQAPQLKSVDADVLILDEVDEIDPRAPDIARKRLGHSSIADERWLSTPSYPGVGINGQYMESDKRQWHFKCSHCGEWMTPSLEDIVTETDVLGRPKAWHGMEEERAYFPCPKCGKELTRREHGEWVAEKPSLSDSMVGYFIPKLISPITNLYAIVTTLQTVDETRRKESYNQDLGMPYKPVGMSITSDALDSCRRDYLHGPVTIDGRPERTFAGVDVGRILHVVIRGEQNRVTGEYPQRFAGEVEWDELLELLHRYNVRICVMDALPETKKAREMQDLFGERGKFWLAYYSFQSTGSKKEPPVNWDWSNLVAHCDRTRTLDTTLARFLDDAAKNTLPANARSIGDYYDHMKAPTRTLEERRSGETVAVYRQISADHFAHAENYCTIARMCPGAGGWTMGVGN